MPKINSTEFGSITIDDIKYSQVLIVGDKVMEREYSKLKELFGTSHKIGDWEVEELLKESPETIIIGTGQDAMLEVDEGTVKTFKDNDIKLIIEKTPQAIETYNTLKAKGVMVNSLIHTTC
ncbi:MAG: MTH938/NDUFAF3 family protein [bacterium]